MVKKLAAGGAFGATIGALAGLVIMLLVYFLDRKSIHRRVNRSQNVETETNREILKKILIISIPITVGACIAPIMSYLDSPIVVTRLTQTGWGAETAKNRWNSRRRVKVLIIGETSVIAVMKGVKKE